MTLKTLRHFRILHPLCALLLMASAATAQSTSSTVIFACVSNLTGVTRIVPASPGACHMGLESVVQWNQQGPAGPTGPLGPQGPAAVDLPHVVPVPSGPDAIANGNNLATAIRNITDASVVNPYVVQLDAGYFKIPNLTLPAYVSLRGALTGSTTIVPSTYLCDKSEYCNDSVSILTLAGGNTLAELSVDLLPISLDASTGTYTLHDVYSTTSIVTFSVTAGQSIRIGSSTLKALNGLNPNNLQATDLLAVGSQVGSFAGMTYQTSELGRKVDGLHCIATFNTSYVPYTSTCQ